ncbi:DUF2637 domain-containing protein [Actinoplanes sp. CA-030573]|uniref:DUF2637 domain-containing protein n=1 Tax=Actinoplanes sp. CA-030573 TaxID=3239898 RepID=UPI003D9300BA
MITTGRLTQLRWGVRAVLALGVAASVTANVLHARTNPVSQAIAGWPPIALLLTVELISRIPVYRRSLAAVRIGATAIIAGIAAWVSYWHMAGVAARYGETGASAYLLPLSVDGLVVVASVCLVELGSRAAASPIPAPDARSADRAAASAPPTNGTTAHRTSSSSPAAASTPASPQRSATTNRRGDGRRVEAPRTPAVSGDSTAYHPTNDDDAAMYRAWLQAVADGRHPSGADLARAVGRADDNTGVGRRAARRYRTAHVSPPIGAVGPSGPLAVGASAPQQRADRGAPGTNRQSADVPLALAADGS